MALYVLFENNNTFLFLDFICLLLNLQMCQIILPDPVYTHKLTNFNHFLKIKSSNQLRSSLITGELKTTIKKDNVM